MFSITLITMGKLKEKFYISAAEEYKKRLGGYCAFTLLELPEARLPENPSPGEIESGLEKEAELIFSKIPKGSWFCVLTPEGKELSSEVFADKLRDVKNSGKSSACFLIGSSFGMSPRVKQRADFRLSMGAMTFPTIWLASWFWNSSTGRKPFKRGASIINRPLLRLHA